MFSNSKASVDYVSSGETALEKIDTKTFDLVLMDISLPGMDGIDTMKTIKGKLGNKAPKIIAVTAHAMDGDSDMFLQEGFTDYISKPFTIEKFVGTIISVLYSKV